MKCAVRRFWHDVPGFSRTRACWRNESPFVRDSLSDGHAQTSEAYPALLAKSCAPRAELLVTNASASGRTTEAG